MAQLDKLAKEVEDTYAAVDGMQKTISLASLKHNIIKGGS